MLELLTSFYTFWNYCDDLTTLARITFTIKRYGNFVKWYMKNPEVKIKYSKVITTSYSKGRIDQIYHSLQSHDLKFSDGVTKSNSELSFEIEDSKLSYRISVDKISNSKENILFSTKYTSFFPLRYFRKLNEITGEFNQIYQIISNPLNMDQVNHVIFVEVIKVGTANKELRTFDKLKAQVIFNKNKIQINNLQGTEQGEFILYFLMKWLQEYK